MRGRRGSSRRRGAGKRTGAGGTARARSGGSARGGARGRARGRSGARAGAGGRVGGRVGGRIALGIAAGLVGLGVIAVLAVLVLAPHPQSTPPDADSAAPRWAAPGAVPTVAASPGAGISGLVDADWAAQAARATGIPKRSVLAYAGAALWEADNRPECKLSWTTLAAIGDVESSNGQHGGSTVGADGTVTPPIYGVALNGNGTALIPDSDRGAIDGDATADRAVGPMQLIPQTWRNWHSDGNGDGVEDPQNMDDAVMAAGRYLCRASTALDTEAGWRGAIAAYNSADSYLAKVARVALAYNAAVAR